MPYLEQLAQRAPASVEIAMSEKCDGVQLAGARRLARKSCGVGEQLVQAAGELRMIHHEFVKRARRPFGLRPATQSLRQAQGYGNRPRTSRPRVQRLAEELAAIRQ